MMIVFFAGRSYKTFLDINELMVFVILHNLNPLTDNSMKRNLLLLSVMLFAGTVFSQMTLSLSDSSGSMANDDTRTYQLPASTETIYAYAFITNNGATTMTVKVKKVELSLANGSTNTFCWGACFPPDVYVSPISIDIPAGGTNYFDFLTEYYPNATVGQSLIRYVFFDVNNPTDTVCFKVLYSTFPMGIGGETAGRAQLSAPYPNPSSEVVHFNYQSEMADARLVVVNMLGTKVADLMFTVKEGKITLPVAKLPQGVYFASLISGTERLQTQRFVVR